MHGSKRIARVAFIVALAVYLILAFGTASTRAPWCDEAWFANPAYNLITHGFMGTTVLEPTGLLLHPQGINRYTYWIPPLHIITQAGWYEVFGFSLFSLRALSVVWGLVALASWLVIVDALSGDRTVALVTFCFLALDYTFVSTAAFGRMDMMSAALGFAALAAYLRLRARHFALAVPVSQGLVAASGLTHPMGGVLAFAALAFLTLYMDRKRIRSRQLAAAALPYVVGAVGWGFYILKSPHDFLLQFGGNVSGPPRFTMLSSPWTNVRLEITSRYGEVSGLASSGLFRFKGLIMVAYLAAAIGALCIRGIRHRPGFRVLLILAGIYVLGLAILDGTKAQWYLIYSVTLLCATWSVWVSWLWSTRSLPRSLIMIGVFGLLCIQVGVSSYRIRLLNYQKDYMPVVTFLRANAPAGSLVMGSAELGFGLGFDSNLIDDETLGYYTQKRPDFFVMERHYEYSLGFYRVLKPDIYRHVTRLLSSDYRVAYDSSYYKVYMRRYLR